MAYDAIDIGYLEDKTGKISSATHIIEHCESVFIASLAEGSHALIEPGSEGHDLYASCRIHVIIIPCMEIAEAIAVQ
jgi:hypothetical protein